MKKLSAFLFAAAVIPVCAQTTITLQPGASTGKDAYFRDAAPTTNQGTHADFSAVAWTSGGNPVIVRSVLEFDLTSIPTGSTIISAELSLYNNPTSSNNGGEHSSLSGTNSSVLRRITSSWSESTVTWNTQPTVTTLNEVVLAQSTSVNQDYLNIDVSMMVQDMVNSPSTSFGFMLMLQTESYYRCMLFSSSDHTDATNHPKLVVTYTPVSVNEINNSSVFINAYPNPSADNFTIEFNNPANEIHTLKLFDSRGKLVRTETGVKSGATEIKREELPSGIYFLQLETNGIPSGSTKLMLE